MNQKRFGMGIPSLNLMALNARNDTQNKETVRMKKETSSEDDFIDDFVIDDNENEKVEEPPNETQIDLNPQKKRKLQGQPDPKSYLKPSQVQKIQGKEASLKQNKNIKTDLVSARKQIREETKIPEKRSIPKRTTPQNATPSTAKKTEVATAANNKPGNISAAPSRITDNRDRKQNGPTPAAVAVKATAAALKDKITKAENEVSAAKNAPKASPTKISPVKERPVRKEATPTTLNKQPQEHKEVKKVKDHAPSCFYRPPSSRRNLDDKTPATSRVPSKATQATKRPATTARNPPNPEKATAAKKTEAQSRIPATARNKKPMSIAKEINPMMTESERNEVLKEYGEDFFDDINDMGWLDSLDEKERQLQMNFKAAEAFDPSILNLYEAGSSQITQKPGEDEFDVAVRMLDAGFEAIHQQSMAEKEMLDERAKLLEQIHAELLIDHTAAYNAHLEK